MQKWQVLINELMKSINQRQISVFNLPLKTHASDRKKAIWQNQSSCHFSKIIQFIRVRVNLLNLCWIFI